METRRFGRTGHFSTVAILGGAAFGKTDQATTDAAMERALAAGVNHIDDEYTQFVERRAIIAGDLIVRVQNLFNDGNLHPRPRYFR